VTVTNTGASTISGWALEFTFPAGQTLTEGWSANWSQQGADVTATNLDWNGTLGPGQSTQIGFNGLATAIGNNPPPALFTLNGVGCATG
jgi:cellulase/cellobiase CelA1